MQVLKKKKRGFFQFNDREVTILNDDYDDLKKNILNVMKYHIGKENKISIYNIFKLLFHVEPDKLDMFTKFYYWNMVKKMFKELKGQNLFVIHEAGFYFVLKTEDELRYYIKKENNHIKAINENIIRARQWVEGEEWKKL